MRYFDARTRAIFGLQVLAVVALVALACWLELDEGIRGGFLVAGVLAAIATVLFGRWADAVLRARLQVGL